MTTPHLLHIFASFEVGGAQRRFAALANAFGGSYRHTLIAMDGNFEAAKVLDSGLDLRLTGRPGEKGSWLCPVRLRRLIARLKPDLTLTYNWGAMDAVAAGRLAGVCPVIHTEDGFGVDEAQGLKLRRVLARRVLLNRIWRTVVPSNTLERIALERYRVARRKVRFIPNGVDIARFRPGLSRSLRGTLGIEENGVLFGFVGHLRREKNLGLLLRAFSAAAIPDARLLLLGSGPCEAELRRTAAELNLNGSVIFRESTPDPAPYYAAMDVFVLSSSTEQMPISLLEAMACGLPAVCTDVGDVRAMLAQPDSGLAPAGDPESYTRALMAAASGARYREQAGASNRARCQTQYSLDHMIGAYRALYDEGIQSARFPRCGQSERIFRKELTSCRPTLFRSSFPPITHPSTCGSVSNTSSGPPSHTNASW